jgi:hypothetical protein
MGENWTGRAWCYQDKEWCYPQKPTSPMSLEHCDCCMEAAGYEKRWVLATERGDDEPTVEEVDARRVAGGA